MAFSCQKTRSLYPQVQNAKCQSLLRAKALLCPPVDYTQLRVSPQNSHSVLSRYCFKSCRQERLDIKSKDLLLTYDVGMLLSPSKAESTSTQEITEIFKYVDDFYTHSVLTTYCPVVLTASRPKWCCSIFFSGMQWPVGSATHDWLEP